VHAISEFTEEVAPDLLARVDGEIVVLERNVYARFEGVVEGGDTV